MISLCTSLKRSGAFQGVCDLFSGVCECRDGFEGRACERSESDEHLMIEYIITVYVGLVMLDAVVACPSTAQSFSEATLQAAGFVFQDATFARFKVNETDASRVLSYRQCSGHGMCKTMREMGSEFNGL